jgi:hypothetical protein
MSNMIKPTLQDLAASAWIQNPSCDKKGLAPHVTHLLKDNWESLKADAAAENYILPIMRDIEKKVGSSNQEKVHELFFKLAKRCDVQSTNNVVPVSVETYICLEQKYKDEAIVALWDVARLQLSGDTSPYLKTPTEIRAWLANPKNAHQLAGITLLTLSSKGLHVIPDEIKFFPQLQTLWLDDNKITSIPPAIGSCSQLRVLWLEYNEIMSIPLEISSCSQLRELSLNDNLISSIPPAIGSCPELRELSLNHNQISSIPSEISSCPKLRVLSLNHNQVSLIPDTIAFCPNLAELYLDSNQVSSISPAIGSWSAQPGKRLWLNNNPIRTF